MRAILKLVAVGAVIAVLGIAQSIELYAIGGGLLLLMPVAIIALDRKRTPAPPIEARKQVTLDVIPLPMPRPQPMPGREDEDLEGKTVRAPMTSEQAYEMHARYAPSFDQQLAIDRHRARYGEQEPAAAASPSPAFDQGRYAAALEYADAFEEQLTARRRTSAHEVAPPRRVARGSYTPQLHGPAVPDRVAPRSGARVQQQARPRSDQRPQHPNDWESKTLVGVRPVKPGK